MSASANPDSDLNSMIALAKSHDLDLVPESLTLNEMGLDFRVALADDVEGVPWVLRIPRRPEVLARAADEARLPAGRFRRTWRQSGAR